MSAGYELAHRLGLRPWERAADGGRRQFAGLLDREEHERGQPPGAALDLGCGTGLHTVELSRRGWRSVGVDAVAVALDRARARDGSEAVRFVHADVARLDEAGLEGPFDFFLDIGCFHGLRDADRVAMGRSVTALAADGATMLLLAFAPGHRVGLPRGADRAGIGRAFPQWRIEDEEAADTAGMPGPLKRTSPVFHRLRLG